MAYFYGTKGVYIEPIKFLFQSISYKLQQIFEKIFNFEFWVFYSKVAQAGQDFKNIEVPMCLARDFLYGNRATRKGRCSTAESPESFAQPGQLFSQSRKVEEA